MTDKLGSNVSACLNAKQPAFLDSAAFVYGTDHSGLVRKLIDDLHQKLAGDLSYMRPFLDVRDK